MTKEAIDAIVQGLDRTRAQEQAFAFAPNGEQPMLVIRGPAARVVTSSNFRTEAEEELGIPYGGGSVFVGRVTRTEGAYLFHVDPEASKGQLDAAKMQRALGKLGKQIKKPKLGLSDVKIGDGPVNDGRPESGDERGRDVRDRIRGLLDRDLPMLLREGERLQALDPLDQRGTRDCLRDLRTVRDELKLFLESKGSTKVLPGKKKDRIEELVEEVGARLDEVRAAGRALQDRLDHLPRVPPEDHPVPPLALQVDQVSALSKRVGKALEEYLGRVGPGTDHETHKAALLALHQVVLEWHVRHPDPDPDTRKNLRLVLELVKDKLAEVEIQAGIDSGQVWTTGEHGPTGASGSYFVGDPRAPRQWVVKPFEQEGGVYGVGGRNELRAGFVAERLRLQGLDVGIPEVSLVSVDSRFIGQTGRDLAPEHEPAGLSTQTGVGIRGIEKVRGSGASMELWVHPLNDQIRMREVRGGSDPEWLAANVAVARPLFEQHQEGFVDLAPDQQREILEAFVRQDHRTTMELLPGLTDESVVRDLGLGLLTCVITGQQDHSNPDNVLVSGDGDQSRLVAIDFGLSNPTLSSCLGDFGRATSDKDPWGLWVAFPQSELPMPPDLLRSLAGLDEAELLRGLDEDEERMRTRTGEPEGGNHARKQRLERQRTRDARVHAALLTTRLAVERGLALTPKQFHDVFVDRRPEGDAPFLAAYRPLLPAIDRTEQEWADARARFDALLPEYLAGLAQ